VCKLNVYRTSTDYNIFGTKRGIIDCKMIKYVKMFYSETLAKVK